MDAEPQEPAADLHTLADLPFHVLGRHPKPLLVGQVKDGGVAGHGGGNEVSPHVYLPAGQSHAVAL